MPSRHRLVDLRHRCAPRAAAATPACRAASDCTNASSCRRHAILRLLASARRGDRLLVVSLARTISTAHDVRGRKVVQTTCAPARSPARTRQCRVSISRRGCMMDRVLPDPRRFLIQVHVFDDASTTVEPLDRRSRGRVCDSVLRHRLAVMPFATSTRSLANVAIPFSRRIVDALAAKECGIRVAMASRRTWSRANHAARRCSQPACLRHLGLPASRSARNVTSAGDSSKSRSRKDPPARASRSKRRE